MSSEETEVGLQDSAKKQVKRYSGSTTYLVVMVTILVLLELLEWIERCIGS